MKMNILRNRNSCIFPSFQLSEFRVQVYKERKGKVHNRRRKKKTEEMGWEKGRKYIKIEEEEEQYFPMHKIRTFSSCF